MDITFSFEKANSNVWVFAKSLNFEHIFLFGESLAAVEAQIDGARELSEIGAKMKDGAAEEWQPLAA